MVSFCEQVFVTRTKFSLSVIHLGIGTFFLLMVSFCAHLFISHSFLHFCVCLSITRKIIFIDVYSNTYLLKDCFTLTFRFPSVHVFLSFTQKKFFIGLYTYTYWPRDCFTFISSFGLCTSAYVIQTREKNLFTYTHMHTCDSGLISF